MKDGFASPIIQKYQKTLAENPDSRVFAPLAESYRRLSLHERAFELLKDGIKRNPDYVLGYLVLAFCYADKEEHQLVYTTLRPLVHKNRDNLRLQKLFAQSCLKLQHIDEALETYKYLLFINPKDTEIASKVKELDNISPVEERRVIEEEASTNQFHVEELKVAPDEGLEGWVQKDFSKTETLENEDEAWEVKKSDEMSDISEDNIQSQGTIEEEREFKVELVEEDSPRDLIEQELGEGPVITHTLVDLYCAQGHFTKAIEILEKILVVNPDDKLTQEKLEEVNQLFSPSEINDDAVNDIESEKPVEDIVNHAIEKSMVGETFSGDAEGRNELMEYFDAKVAEHSQYTPSKSHQDSGEMPLEIEESQIDKTVEATEKTSIDNNIASEKRDRLMAFLGAVKIRAKQARHHNS